MKNEIVLFESSDNAVKLEVAANQETVWLTQSQMTLLFNVDRTVITRHIGNIFREGELEQESNVQKMHIANADRPAQFYNLDVIISVGYRVKSQRGVEFRRWANGVLKQYLLQGYAVNKMRLAQMGMMIRLMKRSEQMLDAPQVLSVIQRYNNALDNRGQLPTTHCKSSRSAGDSRRLPEILFGKTRRCHAIRRPTYLVSSPTSHVSRPI
ncbi:MAG: virulence RhuM family protein [Victivallales bacterium]|nr:virulence RhuM family protein [Victivallales bacterium]